jgi:imidazolonepropionase-like amidohydrolase
VKSLALLAAALIFVTCHTTQGAGPLDALVIEGVSLVDCEANTLRPNVTIVIEGDRIVSVGTDPEDVPRGAHFLPGKGKWVIAGLVDTHVHESSEAYLQVMLAWGVTTVHLMPRRPPDDPVGIERESEQALSATPRLQLTEMFAGEFPDNILPGVYELEKPRTVEEARRAVRASHDRGYRQIKIIQDDSVLWSGARHRVPMLSQPVYEALVSEARSLGMRVYVHATQREVASAALSTGLDAFMHGVMDEELGAEIWQRMTRSGSVWTPTVNALHCFGDQRAYAALTLTDESFTNAMPDAERAHVTRVAGSESPLFLPALADLVQHHSTYREVLLANTRGARDAGVTLAVGTDGGPAGISTHLELEFLQDGGLTPFEVLTAATRGGALALGREADLGSIEPGKLADLVVLNADPSVDVRNCRSIEWVIKGGAVYSPPQAPGN